MNTWTIIDCNGHRHHIKADDVRVDTPQVIFYRNAEEKDKTASLVAIFYQPVAVVMQKEG